MASGKRIAAVLGVGPGIGLSVAKKYRSCVFCLCWIQRAAHWITVAVCFLRFAREGYTVALLSRSVDKLRGYQVAAWFRWPQRQYGSLEELTTLLLRRAKSRRPA